MINIDKTDELYTYLSNLGADNVDELYLDFAKNGRYKRVDIRAYFNEPFCASLTKEFDEKELEHIVDYYSEIKEIKSISASKLNDLLKNYKDKPNQDLLNEIVNACVKDVFYMSCNYTSNHEGYDLQDVIQIANMGLIKAVDKFKPSSRIPFKDYINYWVNDMLTNEFKEKNND